MQPIIGQEKLRNLQRECLGLVLHCGWGRSTRPKWARLQLSWHSPKIVLEKGDLNVDRPQWSLRWWIRAALKCDAEICFPPISNLQTRKWTPEWQLLPPPHSRPRTMLCPRIEFQAKIHNLLCRWLLLRHPENDLIWIPAACRWISPNQGDRAPDAKSTSWRVESLQVRPCWWHTCHPK